MVKQNLRTAVMKFMENFPKEKLLRAAARLSPILGASIAELIPTGDVKKIINSMQSITDEQTEHLLLQIKRLEQEINDPSSGPIAIIGSGNLEMLLHSPSNDSIVLGSKHSVKVQSLWGGSGVNFAARLLSSGRLVLPVLPIADDHAGKQIINALESAAEDGGVADEIKELWSKLSLFNPEVSTPTTVLIIKDSERTAFRQQAKTSIGYLENMKQQIDNMYSICDMPSALLIGHVPRGDESPASTAEVVEHVLNKYRNRTFIYSVFGSSQLRMSWKHWETHIRDNIDIFQLNLSEAKSFFSENNEPVSTGTVIKRLREMGTSAVLTMDKFGAIAIYSESDDIYVAWPFVNARNVLDSTGAGDAFAAGMVSVLSNIGQNYSSHDFEEALAEGSRWAGAACVTQGGAGRSPGKELSKFIDKNENCRHNNVETRRQCSVQELLTFIDLAYE